VRCLITYAPLQVAFLMYTLFSVDWFNENVQDLVGTDGVVTVSFRVHLLALMGLNAVAAFAAEALSGGVVALIQRYRPPPPVQLLFTTPPRSHESTRGIGGRSSGSTVELGQHSSPTLHS